MISSRMEEATDDELICSKQQLKAKMEEVAQEISTIAICSPIVVKFFTNCPRIFIKTAVTIQKLHLYVTESIHQLETDTSQLRDIFIVYERKLTFEEEISPEEYEMLGSDMEYFWGIMERFYVMPPKLPNYFIDLQLAVHSVGYSLHINFPEYLLSFGELDFIILCKCLIQFFRRPNYDFASVKDRLSKMIQRQFEQFLDANVSQTGDQVHIFKLLFVTINESYSYADDNPFKVHIFNDLISKSSFNCIMFALLRKVKCLGPLFKEWVAIMIRLGKYHEAMDLVEFVLSFYTSLSLELQILKLVQQHEDWAREWIQTLMTYKFLTISPIFLNGVPYYFIILNKLLMLYKFKDQYDFNQKLDQLGYEGASKTLAHDEQTKKSMLDMLRQCTEDYEELFYLLLKDGEV